MTPAKYLELLARARRDFPGAFPAAGSTRPLGVGTFEALVAAWPDLSKKSLRRFLNGYASNCLYRQAIAASGPRYRLDGETDGEVTEEPARSCCGGPRRPRGEGSGGPARGVAGLKRSARNAGKQIPVHPASRARSYGCGATDRSSRAKANPGANGVHQYPGPARQRGAR